MQDEAVQAVLRSDSVLGLVNMLTKGDASRRVEAMVRDTVRDVYDVYRESGPLPWDMIPRIGHLLVDDKLDAIVAHCQNMKFKQKSLQAHWEKLTNFVENRDWPGFIAEKSVQNFLRGINKYGNMKLSDEVIGIFNELMPHCQATLTDRLIRQNHSNP